MTNNVCTNLIKYITHTFTHLSCSSVVLFFPISSLLFSSSIFHFYGNVLLLLFLKKKKTICFYFYVFIFRTLAHHIIYCHKTICQSQCIVKILDAQKYCYYVVFFRRFLFFMIKKTSNQQIS